MLGTLNVTGSPGVPAARLLSSSGWRPARPYQRDALNARIEKYLSGVRSRGYYEAKVTPAVSLADGERVANLTLRSTAGRTCASCSPATRCPSNRHAELVPVEREASVDEDLLEDSTNRIEEYLRAQGYRDARGAAHAP